MDYIEISTVLEFAACEQRQCVNITITNDDIPETVESFFVNLNRTLELNSSISLAPVQAEIEINDSDSKY